MRLHDPASVESLGMMAALVILAGFGGRIRIALMIDNPSHADEDLAPC